jgi:electron transfer flavoprotein beta subunit
MKILVAISKTPETTAKISFTPDSKALNKDGIQFIMNPYDEWYALVRALELQEKFGGTVTVINVGLAENDVIIRKALAIGAADAVRVNAEPTNSKFVAQQIANYAKDQGFDLILFGKETIDYSGALVPGMVAEMLDLPFFSFAHFLEIEGTTATVTRDIEGGEEIAEAQLPIVISAIKGMAEQRIPNMRGIMMAKRKPLTVVEASGDDKQMEVLHYALPPDKSEVKLVDPENMDELVRLLHEEAKVI